MCVRQTSLHIVPDDDNMPEKASLPVQADGHPQVGPLRPASDVTRSKTDQEAEEAALYLGPLSRPRNCGGATRHPTGKGRGRFGNHDLQTVDQPEPFGC